MNYDLEKSGNRIRQLRIKSGFIQEQIAEVLNIDRSFYSRIESGKEKRPALLLKNLLRCPCGGAVHRLAGANRRKDTLYLKCQSCGAQVTIPDADLLAQVSRQMAEHDHPVDEPYMPSGEVVRLNNAINRGLEHPDAPEDVVDLILQGVSARYDCCPAPIEQENKHRLSEANLKRFGQTVSHVTITGNQDVTVHFK